ncbi:hypothetical protein EX30DRAFT_247452 [Ascodesmis nigricans]|uniref:Secreted protein n=1 Tax=Ascodesmis nigricans TaxID=341454 RepID=A0A4S2MMP4_9PEZI|nr:hypothetical protein EX30DRAFT_247452 [Ascodesmis nigricans]
MRLMMNAALLWRLLPLHTSSAPLQPISVLPSIPIPSHPIHPHYSHHPSTYILPSPAASAPARVASPPISWLHDTHWKRC